MPALQSRLRQTATLGDIYASAAPPDLVTVFNNTPPTISKTIVDEQDNLNATLLSTIGLANNGYDTFAPPAQDDYIAAIQRLRAPPLKVLGDYSPELGCLLQAVTKAIHDFAPPVLGGTKPGLFTSSNFILGAPNYTYPESLPMVNATGGPNCRGLPHMPSKQLGGSWYHSPFLVTDNATSRTSRSPSCRSTRHPLCSSCSTGAFAERDDF